MPLVVDNSVFRAWCIGDEDEPEADAAMERVAEEGGIVPRIRWFEMRNALLLNERRNRISPQQVSDTLAATRALRVVFDDRHDDSQILTLAPRFGLTVYDAAYLEIAFRRSLPLATLDRRLLRAARAIGVETPLNPS